MKIISMVTIKTPRGDATIHEYVWSSEDKELEHELNSKYGKESEYVEHEHRQHGVALHILAIKAIEEFGGEIIKIKRSSIRREIPEDSVG